MLLHAEYGNGHNGSGRCIWCVRDHWSGMTSYDSPVQDSVSDVCTLIHLYNLYLYYSEYLHHLMANLKCIQSVLLLNNLFCRLHHRIIGTYITSNTIVYSVDMKYLTTQHHRYTKSDIPWILCQSKHF